MTVFAGWQLECKIGTTLASVTGSSPSASSVDGIQRISYDYTQNLDAKEATGQRTVYAIVEGVIGLSGVLERFWTGSGTQGWARGAGETGSLTSYYIGIYPNGAVAGQPYTALDSCKFGAHRTVHRLGSALMTETLDFIGIREYTGSL